MTQFLLQIDTFALTITGSALLAIICLTRLLQQYKKSKNIQSYLKDKISSLKAFDRKQDDIQSMSVDGFWYHNWSMFCNSLIDLETNAESKKWASQDPATFFTTNDIQSKGGLNLRAMASFPSTLTGLGITFTFLGLVIGVTAAGENLTEAMASTEPNLLGMIEPLLSGAGLAFITSLIGLCLSLIYTVCTQRNTSNVQLLVNQWNEEIKAIWPLINNTAVVASGVNIQKKQTQLIEQLVSDSSKSLENQSQHGELLAKMTKSIADDLSVAMIRALDQIRDDRRQSDHEMVEQFHQCLTQMSDEFNGSIKKMVEQFHSTVRDMAGEEMERFSGQLRKLHSEYVTANKYLVDANTSMLENVSRQSSETLTHTKDITEQLSDSTEKVDKFTSDVYQRFEQLQKHMQQWVLDTLEESRNVIHSDLIATGYSLKESAQEAGELLKDNANKAGEELKAAGLVFTQGVENSATGLSETGISLQENVQTAGEQAKESIHQSGELLKNQVSLASETFIDSANKAGEELKAAGLAFTQAVDTSAAGLSETGSSLKGNVQTAAEQAKENILQSGELLKNHVSLAGEVFVENANQAGEKLTTAGSELSEAIHKSSERLAEMQGELHNQGVSTVEQLLNSAGETLKEKASTAGEELISGGREASKLIEEGSANIGKEAKTLGESFSGAMEGVVEQAQAAGMSIAKEIDNSISGIAKEQESWATRHEQAAERLVINVETLSDNIHQTTQGIMGDWSEKVADASASLVIASERSGKLADSIQPMIDTQEEVTRELTIRAEELAKVSQQNQPIQQQVADSLEKARECYELLASNMDEAIKVNSGMEEQLQNLSEEFAAQYADFTDNITEQLTGQKENWNKQEKAYSAMMDRNANRMKSMDDGIANAMESVNSGLQDFAKDVSKFVRELDHNSNAILETLSSAIEEMQGLEDKRASDELQTLADSVADMQKMLKKVVKNKSAEVEV